jgi:hypothetical protein
LVENQEYLYWGNARLERISPFNSPSPTQKVELSSTFWGDENFALTKVRARRE